MERQKYANINNNGNVQTLKIELQKHIDKEI